MFKTTDKIQYSLLDLAEEAPFACFPTFGAIRPGQIFHGANNAEVTFGIIFYHPESIHVNASWAEQALSALSLPPVESETDTLSAYFAKEVHSEWRADFEEPKCGDYRELGVKRLPFDF